AAAWRSQPKWVVSSSLKSVGPNATLVEDDIEAVISGVKGPAVWGNSVGGPDPGPNPNDPGVFYEYLTDFLPRRVLCGKAILLRPVVLGRGKPFFAGPRPPLRLVANDRIGEDAIRLTYVPA